MARKKDTIFHGKPDGRDA